MDVLKEIARGKSNKEIAASLFITEKTVKTHVSNLLAKLELADRTQAALYAVKNQLVEQPGHLGSKRGGPMLPKKQKGESFGQVREALCYRKNKKGIVRSSSEALCYRKNKKGIVRSSGEALCYRKNKKGNCSVKWGGPMITEKAGRNRSVSGEALCYRKNKKGIFRSSVEAPCD